MAHLSFTPFNSELSFGKVNVFDITGLTHVDGQRRSDIVSQLIIVRCYLLNPEFAAKGVEDNEELKYFIADAMGKFAELCLDRMSEKDTDLKIKELRNKDEARTAVSYSRQCNICFSPNPETRAVLTACGHFLCMACVLTMAKKGRLVCPFCRTNTAYVKVHEEISEEVEEVQERVSELEMKTPLVDDIPTSSPSSAFTDPPPPVEVGENINSRSIATSLASNIRRLVPRFRSIRRSRPQNTIRTPSPYTVRVTNLPLGTTASDLSILFNQYEQFSIVRFAVSPFGDNLHACCDFEDEQSARNVCTVFNNFVYRDRTLNLRMVD